VPQAIALTSAAWRRGCFIDEYVSSCFEDSPQQQLRDHLADYAARLDLCRSVQILGNLIATDLEPDLPRIDVPAAIIHGRADASRPVSHSERLAAGIPHSRLFILDSGHTPMIEDPASFWRAMTWVLEQPVQLPEATGGTDRAVPHG
jgi:3-oxoadipate enol-lactonase